MEADRTIWGVIELHRLVESDYGQAREFVIKSTMVWRQSRIVGLRITGNRMPFTRSWQADKGRAMGFPVVPRASRTVGRYVDIYLM